MTEVVNSEPVWPARRARAAATKRAVVDAATALFVANGYAATTIAEVAEAARVSRATVFNSIGGKPELLKTCYDVAMVGDDESAPLFERPEMMAMFAEPDADQTIRRYARIISAVGARISPIYEVFRAAAGADAEIRRQWHEIQQERHFGATKFIDQLVRKGRLKPGLTRAQAADVVWLLIDNGNYHRLVVERGWTPRQFERWFATTLQAQLLPQ
jgi:AcrR family transcriptional regulator